MAHHTENLPMLCLKKGKKIRPMPRKAHEFRDFRGYLNWSYTPESPDFLRNQDFFRIFVSKILLAVFSDPNADPNGSGQRKALYRTREDVTHCFCRFTLGRGRYMRVGVQREAC